MDDGFKIVRNKGPNKLIVNDVYHDSEAQQLIDKRFSSVFTTIGIIKQKSVKNFTSLTPAEKLKFLEDFSFKDIRLKQTKEDIKLELKNRKKLMIKKDGELEMINKIIKDKVVGGCDEKFTEKEIK